MNRFLSVGRERFFLNGTREGVSSDRGTGFVCILEENEYNRNMRNHDETIETGSRNNKESVNEQITISGDFRPEAVIRTTQIQSDQQSSVL